MCRVISQKWERVSFERLSTPPPKVVLKKSSWQTQQPQDTSQSASSRIRKHAARNLLKEEPKEDPCNPTEDSETSRSLTLICEKDSSVEENPECKVEGRAHDVILKDEERMDQIREVVDN